MYLDLGQRNFGRTIECKECGFVYAEGEASDEAAHRKHHRRHMMGLHVRGPLASLHVLTGDGHEPGGRIILLSDMDGVDALRKLAEVKAVVDAELGGGHDTSEQPAAGLRALLALEQHTGRLRGCAFAEPCTFAYRVVVPTAAAAADEKEEAEVVEEDKENVVVQQETKDLMGEGEGDNNDNPNNDNNHDDDDAEQGDGKSREEAASAVVSVPEEAAPLTSSALSHDGQRRPAMCGISHIWVDAKDRRRGVAKALLDAARRHFATGFEVPLGQLAFSQPTQLGRRLAASYSGREDFLVY